MIDTKSQMLIASDRLLAGADTFSLGDRGDSERCEASPSCEEEEKAVRCRRGASVAICVRFVCNLCLD